MLTAVVRQRQVAFSLLCWACLFVFARECRGPVAPVPVAPQPYAYQNTPQAVPVSQGYQGAPTAGGYGNPSYAAGNAYGAPPPTAHDPPPPSAPLAASGGGYGGPDRRDNRYT